MRLIPLLFLGCFTALNSFAQFSFTDSAVMARIRQDIYTLASDSMQGRKAGTEGERKAQQYIIGRLREAGISAWKESNYLQPFKKEYVNFSKPASLRIAGKSFPWRYDFGICYCSSSDSVSALCADFGYGLEKYSGGYVSATATGSLEGKIALIDLGPPPASGSGSIPEAELLPESRIANAIGRGASGVLLYNDPGKYKKRLFDFSRSDTFAVPVVYILADVAWEIRKYPGDKLTLSVHVKRVSPTFSNIIAYIGNNAAQTIILGAHYDHIGQSLASKDKGVYCTGADDNASGTAGILELARYYSQHRDTLNNYLIILFSAEEEGLLGSEHFTKQMSTGLRDSVNFMVNFDMIGRLGCEGMQVTAEATGSSTAWSGLYRKVPHAGFRLKKISPSLPFSDQDPFYLKGIPILYLTTGLHGYYHTPRDRPETINYTGMVSIVNYAEKLVNTAGSGKKATYRKIPALGTFFKTAGFVFDFIGESLSF